MSNLFFIKCFKDIEGWWIEGEIYEVCRVVGGFVQFGDDN